MLRKTTWQMPRPSSMSRQCSGNIERALKTQRCPPTSLNCSHSPTHLIDPGTSSLSLSHHLSFSPLCALGLCLSHFAEKKVHDFMYFVPRLGKRCHMLVDYCTKAFFTETAVVENMLEFLLALVNIPCPRLTKPEHGNHT